MLSVCRDKAALKGLRPVLYRQSMQALDLPRKYSTIIVPGGSFQLVVDREEALDALRRFHAHLGPKGSLAISLDDPDDEMSDDWLGQWRDKGTATRTSDGAELSHQRMVQGVDRSERVTTTLLRYAVVREGQPVLEELHTMRMRLYFDHEIQEMLERAGFTDVEARGEARGIATARR